jgi:molybdopterin-binding protein
VLAGLTAVDDARSKRSVAENGKARLRNRPHALVVRVDPTRKEPVHLQLEQQLRAAVANGTLRPGEQLVSIRDTARQLGISPNTVARAYGSLARDGVVVARAGGGSVVASARQLDRRDLRRRHKRQMQALAEELVVRSLALGLEPAEMLDLVGRTFAEHGRPAVSSPTRTLSGTDEEALLSARNRLPGTISHIRGGDTLAEVTLRLADGADSVVVVVTQQSLARLGLSVGAHAAVLAKGTGLTLSR